MKNIKWIGIVKNDLSEYQMGELEDSAKKINMPSTEKMMFTAMPFLFPALITICLSMFVKTYLSNEVIVKPIFVAIGFFVGFIGLLVHELLHAVVYPKNANVYIGIYPKAFAAVVLASYPLKKMRFITMSLLPVILGIVPIVLFWIIPSEYKIANSFLFGVSIMGLVSPYPDLYNVYQICCR